MAVLLGISLIFFVCSSSALSQSAPTITISSPEPGTRIGGIDIAFSFEGEITDDDTPTCDLELKIEYYDGYYWRMATDFILLDFEETDWDGWTDSGADYGYCWLWNSCFECGSPCNYNANIYLQNLHLPGGFTDDFSVRLTVRDPESQTGDDTLTGLIVDQGPDYCYLPVASQEKLLYERFLGDSLLEQGQTAAALARQMDCTMGQDDWGWYDVEKTDTTPENFTFGKFDARVLQIITGGITGPYIRIWSEWPPRSAPSGWFAKNFTGDPLPLLDDWKEFFHCIVERYDGDTDFGVPEGSPAYPAGLSGATEAEKQDWANKHFVKSWEIFSEPNLATYFPWAKAEEYSIVLKASYEEAKAADPFGLCFNGAPTGCEKSWTWVEEMFVYLMDGGALEPYTDTFISHWYAFWTDAAEQAPEDCDGGIVAYMNDAKDVFEYYTGRRDVADSETSYAAPYWGDTPDWACVSLEDQANYYVRETMLLLGTSGNPFMLWHKVKDSGNTPSSSPFTYVGVVSHPGLKKKPVFYAMQNMGERLHGAEFLRQYPLVGGKYIYELWNGSQLVNVAWAHPTDAEVTIDCPADAATLYSWAEGTDQMPGNLVETTVYPVSDQVTFSAGQRPKFLVASLRDTDGDYLPDYFETDTGTFVSLTDTGCDPLNPDSDGDNYSDNLELVSGSDPNVAASVPCQIMFNFQPQASAVPEGMCLAGGGLFSSTLGYGWNGQTATVIKRDPVYYANIDTEKYFPDEFMTFAEVPSGETYYWELNLPPGEYRISLACGDSAVSGFSDTAGPHRVVVEGVAIVNDVTSARSEFIREDDVVVTNDDNILTVAVGGAAGSTCLNYLIVRNPMVNFLPEGSVVKNPNYYDFKCYQDDRGLLYDSGRGYGWDIDMSSQVIQRGSDSEPQYYMGDARLSNCIYANPSQSATFSYDIPDGEYMLNLSCGDCQYGFGPHRVEINGVRVVNDVSTGAGEYATVEGYPVTVTGGQFNLTLGGSSGYSLLNYLTLSKPFPEPATTPTPTPEFTATPSPDIPTPTPPPTPLPPDAPLWTYGPEWLDQGPNSGDSQGMTMAWDASGADTYDLQSSWDTQSENLLTNSSATSYEDYDFLDQTSYYFRVRGKNLGGEGPWCEWTGPVVTLDRTAPDNPTLDIYEEGTFDQQTTHSQTVGVDITSAPDVYYWLLSETQSSLPDPLDPAFESFTSPTFALSPYNGEKTVYLWVRDDSGNVNLGTPQGGINDGIYMDAPDTWPPQFFGEASCRKDGTTWVEMSNWNDSLSPACSVRVKDMDSGLEIIPGGYEAGEDTVGLYHLDGDCLDYSGRGNDGVLSGTDVPVWSEAWIGRGIEFAPQTAMWPDTYIALPEDDDDFDFTNNFTIEAWYQPSTVHLSPCQDYFHSLVYKPGSYWLRYKTCTAKGPVEAYIYAGGQWRGCRTDMAGYWLGGYPHHVAMAYDGREVRLYVNGKQVDPASSSVNPYWDGAAEVNDNPVLLCDNHTGGSIIDEICLTKRCLSSEEIYRRYAESAADYSTDGGSNWSGVWDDFSGDTMDPSVWSSQTSVDLFVTQTEAVLEISGTGGGGGDFNGYISQPVSAEDRIAAAVQLQSSGTNGQTFLDLRLAPDYGKWGRLGINWSAATAQWEFEADDGGGSAVVATRSFDDFPPDEYHFLKMSYQPLTGEAKAFLDGEYLGASFALETTPTATEAQVRLGYTDSVGGGSEEALFDAFFLNCLPPKVKTTSSGPGLPLSPDILQKEMIAYGVPFNQRSEDQNQVKLLALDRVGNIGEQSFTVQVDPYAPQFSDFTYVSYGMAPDCLLGASDSQSGLKPQAVQLNPDDNTVGLWQFDGGPEDVSGHNYGEQLIDGKFTGSGKFGWGLLLEEDARLSISDCDSFDVDAFTLEGWIKPVELPEDMMGIIGKVNSYELIYWYGGILGAIKDDSGLWHTVESDSAHVKLGQWNYVAFTFDGRALVLYINGVRANTVFAPGNLYNSDEPFEIGLNGEFEGMIDEVRLSDLAREPDEIALNYFGALYQYSKDGGSSWSNWTGAMVTGANGSTEIQNAIAVSVPFNQYSEDQNLIRFAAADMAGNLIASDPYLVVTAPSATPTSTPTATPYGYHTPTPTPTLTPEGYHTPTPTPSTTPTPEDYKTPTPLPTPQSLIPIIASGDYDGDGTSDIAIFRGSSGLWAVRNITRLYFGSSSDIPASGDYSADGSADIALYRSATGLWAVRGLTRLYFGGASDLPIPGDYDGDGYCDAGLFRRSTGLWAIRDLTRVYFGAVSDLPVPWDFRGDGVKDIGIFRRSSGLWAIRGLTRAYFGGADDRASPGDYDGDYSGDLAVFRYSTGLWAIRNLTRIYFGGTSDLPVPADYEGDLIDNIGIFRESSGMWAVKSITRAYYGADGDIPVTR